MIAADPEAEKALIAAVLLSKQAFLDVTALIEPEMFFVPSHQHIWEAIEQCSPETNDVVLVAARLKANGFEGDQYSVPSLGAFYAVPSSTGLAKKYARIIFDNHVRRQLLHGIAETSQAMQSGTLDAMAARDDLLSKLAGISTPDDEHESMTADEFIASVNTDYDWLIPGFLERMDRFLLTGGEGSGKSTMLAQLGFMAAAGIHPWVRQPVEPVRVTYVDLENSNRLLARRLNTMRWAVNASRANLPCDWDSKRMRIEHRPHGIDLNKSRDRDWLLQTVLKNKSELLVIGPTYKMYRGAAERNDSGGEEQARRAVAAIDDIRVLTGAALIMETHAPHASSSGHRDLRPIGSSVWLRWPEFGHGIRPVADEGPDAHEFHPFRGDRDRRDWPKVLYKNSKPWPWQAVMA